MKNIVFGLLSLLCFSFYTNAQELKKNKSVFLQGGTVNDGLNIATGVEKLFGKDYTNSLLVTVNYQHLSRTVDAVKMSHNEQNVFFNIGYRKYFPVSYSVSPYVGASLLAGNQYSGYAENGIYTHFAKNEFLYGVGVHTGIEYRLNVLSLFLDGGYMFEFGHSWLLGAGIKYYF